MDDEVMRLHRKGLATGAIAIRLGLPSSHVRSVVRTQLEAPHYNGESAAKRKAQAKLAKAERALEAAEAELSELNVR